MKKHYLAKICSTCPNVYSKNEDFFFLNNAEIPKCVRRLKTIKIIWF